MKEQYKYNGDFSDIVVLGDLKHRVCINALCFTSSIANAAKEVGIAEGNMYKFVQTINLSSEEIKKMRITFKSSKIKIKKRYKN